MWILRALLRSLSPASKVAGAPRQLPPPSSDFLYILDAVWQATLYGKQHCLSILKIRIYFDVVYVPVYAGSIFGCEHIGGEPVHDNKRA